MRFVKDVMPFANGHEPLAAYVLTAYMLIGVDNDGGLHGVDNPLPDEDSLQQPIAAHLDPPVTFSLKTETLRGVRVDVVDIPPGDERFHAAARNVHEPNNLRPAGGGPQGPPGPLLLAAQVRPGPQPLSVVALGL